MLAKLLLVASAALLAALSPVSGQVPISPIGGNTPETNGGVAQFENRQFSVAGPGSCPADWTCSGGVETYSALTPGNNDTNVYSLPNSVAFSLPTLTPQPRPDPRPLPTLGQRLDIYELGQQITIQYRLKFVGGPGTPFSFNIDFQVDGRSQFRAQPNEPIDGTLDANGFQLWRTQFTLDNNPNEWTDGISPMISIAFLLSEASPFTYYVDDVEIFGDAFIVGDPQFVGLRGQSYQVHGVDGEIYNLISSANTQVNSKFVFLDSGNCPLIGDLRAANCWSHPGSYLSTIGVQQIVDGTTHTLVVESGSANQGFAAVTLNGKAMELGTDFTAGSLFAVSYNSSHTIRVQTEEFSFTFENSDMFVNQAVTARKPLSQITAHGLFGQTHERKIYNTAIKYIAGEVDDYVIAEGDLFGKDFVYNQFQL